MIDELGLKKPHGVLHRKTDYHEVPYAPTVWVRHDVPGTQTLTSTVFDINQRNADYFKGILSGYGRWNLNDTTYPNPPGWTISNSSRADSECVNDLFDRADGLKADVMLNLVEANQIWPSLKSLASSIPVMREKWQQVRKILKHTSGQYLAWKFGISPILSDLDNIVKYAPDMERQYQKFRKATPQRFSLQMHGVAQFNMTSLGSVSTDLRSFQGRIRKEPVTRYVLVVKPNLHVATSDAFKRLDFAMRRFSSSPASLLWEKIPFSFIADWFVDVRGALRGIDGLLGHKPYEIVSLTKSLSYSLASDAFWDFYSPCGGGKAYTFKATHEYDYYGRNPVSGGNILPTWRSRFGKNQAAITAALISQRLFRR